MQSVKTTIIGQYIHSTITRVITIGLKAFLAIFLVRQLESYEYGFYSLFVATMGMWISVSDLGWGDYLRREIPALNQEKRVIYYQNSNFLQLVFMCILLTMILSVMPIERISSLIQFQLSAPLTINLCFLLFLSGFFPITQVYLNYSKKIKEFNNMSTMQIAPWMLFMVGAVALLGRVTIDAVCWTWSLSFIFIFIWFLIQYRIQPFGIPTRSFIKESIRYGFPLCFADTGKKIWQYYDRYLLGALTSLSILAPYHFFNTLFDASERFNQITIVPYIFEAHDQQAVRKRNRLIMSIIKTRIIFQAIVILGVVFVIRLIPQIVPAAYSSQVSLFVLVGISSIVGIPSQTCYIILLLEKKSGVTAMSNFLGLAVSLALNLFLIPRFQAHGAAYAMIASTIAITCFQLFFIDSRKYIEWSYLFSLNMEKDVLDYWKRKWPSKKQV